MSKEERPEVWPPRPPPKVEATLTERDEERILAILAEEIGGDDQLASNARLLLGLGEGPKPNVRRRFSMLGDRRYADVRTIPVPGNPKRLDEITVEIDFQAASRSSVFFIIQREIDAP